MIPLHSAESTALSIGAANTDVIPNTKRIAIAGAPQSLINIFSQPSSGSRIGLYIRTVIGLFAQSPASSIAPRLNKTTAPYSQLCALRFYLCARVISLAILGQSSPVRYAQVDQTKRVQRDGVR
jgi:hypothetical protein